MFDRFDELLITGFLLQNVFIAETDKFNVRLTKSHLPNSGRLEVQRVSEDGSLSMWGTVCDNNFGEAEAQVVCRQLGYRFGRSENDVYRDHESLFVLDDVACNGNESELSTCIHSPWLEHHCVSFKNFYAGVCCSNQSSFGEIIGDRFLSHCMMTWSDSLETCSQNYSHILDSFVNSTTENISYWSNQVYTPWIALIGCFEIPESVKLSRQKAVESGPGICAQMCRAHENMTVGVSGSYCYCLHDPTPRRVEPNHCYVKCDDDTDKSCGDGATYMAVYTIVSDDLFVQHTNPSSVKQCALLYNARNIGEKILKSENCTARHSYICEHYTRGQRADYIAPGGMKTDMRTAGEKCHDLAMSLTGFGAVKIRQLHLNHPSWIDISRYQIRIIQNSAFTSDLKSQFYPRWCVVASVDSSGSETTDVIDCQTRHLFACSKAEKTKLEETAPGPVYFTSTKISSVSGTSISEEPNMNKQSNTFDTELRTLLIIVIGSCLILLTLCVASICICIKRRRNRNKLHHIYSMAQETDTGPDIVCNRSAKDTKEYTNTYDIIRGSNEYSEIDITKECQTSATPIHVRNGTESATFATTFRDSHNGLPQNTCTIIDGCFELIENYTEPEDSLIKRKNKLKNVKSSNSYTYPYDSVQRSADSRKTKSAT